MISGIGTLLVIAGAVAFCWVVCLRVLIACFLRRIDPFPAQQRLLDRSWRRWIFYLSLAGVVGSTAAFAYGLWIEPYHPEIVHLRIPLADLNHAKRPIRIVHITNRLHRVGNTWLYVNRGIGMEGGATPRVRFNCRPEVTLLELAGSD